MLIAHLRKWVIKTWRSNIQVFFLLPTKLTVPLSISSNNIEVKKF